MYRFNQSLILALTVAASAGLAQAQLTEFASATLAGEGSCGGFQIAATDWFYSGWRFEVTNGPLRTTDVGGHFGGNRGYSLFGAIVRLTGPNDNPDSFDLTGSDVVGITSLKVPGMLSLEVSAPLDVPLENGWYVVLFGSDAFESTGAGGGLRGQPLDSAIPGTQNIVTYRQASHPEGQGGPFMQQISCRVFVHAVPDSGCAADFNNDGMLDLFDYLDFVAAFAASDPAADFNGDSSIDLFDYLDFVQAFAGGC